MNRAAGIAFNSVQECFAALCYCAHCPPRRKLILCAKRPASRRSATAGKIRIGISGWRYKPWRGVFYPPKLPQRNELNFAAETFSTLEINGTFYSLQRPANFETWSSQTPADFQFAVKGSRYITHLLRLRDLGNALANFFASGVLLLGKKLGPFLWQLPPNFRFDAERIENFLNGLPRDAGAAKQLAKGHDKWMRGQAAYQVADSGYKLRHAMEIRHESFVVPEFLELLRRQDVAIVCADTVEWPKITDVTSDFVYCRLHGSQQLYVSGYDAKALDQWAEWVCAWANGSQPATGSVLKKPAGKRHRDVYVYFDNDAKVRAPFDAQELQKRVMPQSGARVTRESKTEPISRSASARNSGTPRTGPRERIRSNRSG